MSYCIGTNTSTIKTCLKKDSALAAIERLWNEQIVKKLSRFAKDEDGILQHSDVFSKAEQEFLNVESIIEDVYAHSFEGEYYPDFPENCIDIAVDGTVSIVCCEQSSDYCCGEELTDFLCLAVQKEYGSDTSYKRRSECEYPSGHDIVICNVFNDGKQQVIYSTV